MAFVGMFKQLQFEYTTDYANGLRTILALLWLERNVSIREKRKGGPDGSDGG